MSSVRMHMYSTVRMHVHKVGYIVILRNNVLLCNSTACRDILILNVVSSAGSLQRVDYTGNQVLFSRPSYPLCYQLQSPQLIGHHKTGVHLTIFASRLHL